MKRLSAVCMAIALVLLTSPAFAQDFPTVPPNMKEAEAKGLPRVGAEELKAFFPGVAKFKGTTGKHLMTFKPDGSVDRKGFRDTAGKWRIDEQNNAYCLAFTEAPHGFGKMHASKENCFAVFRAPDGTHFFDYDVANGFYAHVWRRAKGE